MNDYGVSMDSNRIINIAIGRWIKCGCHVDATVAIEAQVQDKVKGLVSPGSNEWNDTVTQAPTRSTGSRRRGAPAQEQHAQSSAQSIVITAHTPIETRSIDGPIFILSSISSDMISVYRHEAQTSTMIVIRFDGTGNRLAPVSHIRRANTPLSQSARYR